MQISKESDFVRVPISLNFFIFMIPVLMITGNLFITGFLVLFIFIIFLFNSANDGDLNLEIPYLGVWVILLLWGIFVVQNSPVFYEGVLYYLGTILLPFMIYIIFTNIKVDYKFLNKLFNVFIFSGVILGIASLFVFVNSGFDMKLRIAPLNQHLNIASFSFLIFFMFNFSFLIHRKKGDKLTIYIASIIIILLGIFLSQTRGVWLSLVFALFIFYIRKPKIFISLGIFLLIFIFIFFNAIQDRFLSVVNFGNDLSSLGRLQAWLSSYYLIKNNLLFGYGFESYLYLRDQVFSFYFVEVIHSHNTYLRAILEMGLIGFVLYFFFFYKSYKILFSKRLSLINIDKKFTDGLKLSLLSFIPSFMFEPYVSLYGISVILVWILISIPINNNLQS